LLVFADRGLRVTGAFSVCTESEMNLVGVLPGWIQLENFVELGVGVVEPVQAGQGSGQSLAHERRIGIHLQTTLKNFHCLRRVARAI
jgi:hypothetical protein